MNRRIRLLLQLLFAIGLLGAPSALRAHPIDMGLLAIRIDGEKAQASLQLSVPSWSTLVPLDVDGDGLISAGELEAQLPAMFQVSFGESPITADGAECALEPRAATPQRIASPVGAVRLDVEGTCKTGWTKLRQKLEFLTILAPGHHMVISAELDGERHDKLADRATRVIVFERDKPPGFGSFFALGIEHIFTGYDHLLFLFALLLAGGSLRSLLLVVTSFTVAHSITLALAALEVISLPGRLVESVIALSIMYVAAEDFFVGNRRREEASPLVRHRWVIAFGFGLIHGFGFASILAEMNLARHGILKALLGFNLGVEAGQAMVVIVVAPLIAMARRNPTFREKGVPALSLLVIAAGAYWFVERAILG